MKARGMRWMIVQSGKLAGPHLLHLRFSLPSIGDPPVTYVDGELGYNNPIRSLWDNVTHIWPEREVACIISIGTGVPTTIDVGRNSSPRWKH